MGLQPYIIVTGGDTNTLAANVTAQMANGYVPLGAPFTTVIYGSQISGRNTNAGGVETVSVMDTPANVTYTFCQAMVQKVIYNFDYIYNLYDAY